MTVELNIDKFGRFAATAIGASVIETEIKRAIEEITQRHKEAAVLELSKFIAGVAVYRSEHHASMASKITITIPDFGLEEQC